MASCLQLSAYGLLRPTVAATHQLLKQYVLHAAALFAQIESMRTKLASLEQEHRSTLDIIADVHLQLNS
jgi:hypothetical protein